MTDTGIRRLFGVAAMAVMIGGASASALHAHNMAELAYNNAIRNTVPEPEAKVASDETFGDVFAVGMVLSFAAACGLIALSRRGNTPPTPPDCDPRVAVISP